MNATWSSWLAALLLATVPLGVHAQVYRCTAPNGSVAYQDRPCAQGRRQSVVDVPSRAPPGYVPAPPLSAASPDSSQSASAAGVWSPSADVPLPAPLPAMYVCVGAVNGKRYFTRHPPPPYLAPLGVLGYPPRSLSDVYGAPGGAGVSAPELAPKPRIGGPSIAAGMTEVEDACVPAPKAEVCAFVQREYDDNHHKLRIAMRSEQSPLQQRQNDLRDQLRNCR